jgi:hypothetical protein
MRVVVGDSAFNQRFLKPTLASCGLADVTGATTAEELIGLAVGADLVIFDPAIRCTVFPAVDVAFELVRVVNATHLLVMSSRQDVMDRARRNGIVAVRKRSIFRQEEIQATILVALGNIAAEGSRGPTEYQPRELWSPDGEGDRPTLDASRTDAAPAPVEETFDWDALVLVTPSASASVEHSAFAPTP